MTDESGDPVTEARVAVVDTDPAAQEYSVDLSGDDDRIVAPQAGDLSTFNGEEVTFTHWVKINNTDNQQGLVFTGGGWNRKGLYHQVETDGSIRAQMGSGDDEEHSSTGSITVGEWTLVGVRWDSANENIEVWHGSGQWESVGSWSAGYFSNTDYDVNFGRVLDSNDDPSNFLNGNIAEARIYDHALSAAQMQDLEDGAHVGQGLVAWWPCNEGSGTTVADDAGSNDGEITGGSWDGDAPDLDDPGPSGWALAGGDLTDSNGNYSITVDAGTERYHVFVQYQENGQYWRSESYPYISVS